MSSGAGPEMVETMNRVLGELATGVLTLPRALLEMWMAGCEAERINALLMEKAQREARASNPRRRG